MNTLKKSRRVYEKAGLYISLGALLSKSHKANLMADARELIENTIKKDNIIGRELKKNIRFNGIHTYILKSYKLAMGEFLEQNNFDLSVRESQEELDKRLLRKSSLTGIDQFLKTPTDKFNPEMYNANIPQLNKISIYERERLTEELEKRIIKNGEVYYSPSEIMKLVNIAPADLSKYLNALGPLGENNNGMLGYSSYRVLDFAKRVLEGEKRKAETL